MGVLLAPALFRFHVRPSLPSLPGFPGCNHLASRLVSCHWHTSSVLRVIGALATSLPALGIFAFFAGLALCKNPSISGCDNCGARAVPSHDGVVHHACCSSCRMRRWPDRNRVWVIAQLNRTRPTKRNLTPEIRTLPPNSSFPIKRAGFRRSPVGKSSSPARGAKYQSPTLELSD